MPRPVFIAVADSYSEDRDTNMLSLFRMIERVDFTPAPEGAVSPPEVAAGIFGGVRMYVVAVWMKLPEDSPEQEFEHQTVLIRPDKSEHILFQTSGNFFPSEVKPLMRFAVHIARFNPTKPGTVLFESRMRAAGATEWIVQNYPITVVVNEPLNLANSNHSPTN